MSFRDDLRAILVGGLPQLLELPEGGVPDPAPETTAPEPTIRDTEPFLAGISQQQVLVGGAGLLGLIALIFIARQF